MELKSFLSICTYYRKFVKGFSELTTPLIDLTKKGAFVQIGEAQERFDKMKQVMSSCPVLALPDFTQSFVLECDASEIGIGAVLMQSGHPIAFESRKLREYERHYSIYDKEMLAIMHALTKFRQYSVGNRFKVKTDHNSLKFLMEQKELREWQRLTLGVNLTQQRIRRKSISKRLGHTHYSFWFWISICYCS